MITEMIPSIPTKQLPHIDFLKATLALAAQRRGFCAPNPAVGALVVKDGCILASGSHFAAGLPHAEVKALEQLPPEQSRGADLYVSLEPCSHYGRTPPCTKLLVERGIKAVYYAYKDPNPVVSGEQQLLAAGIYCQHTPLQEINQFYQSYSHWVKHKRPFVTAKLAISLNGKIAGPNGQPIAITGSALNQYTHLQRKQSDAILTTCRTILCDNPQLNARLEGQSYKKPLYILDSHLNLPLDARIFETAASITLFYGRGGGDERQKTLEAMGVRCIPIGQEHGKIQEHNKINLNQVLAVIGQDGIHDLWVEAGGKCWQAFALQGLAHRLLVYVAPKWLSQDATSAFDGELDLSQLGRLSWRAVGNDMVCEVLCSQV